MAQSSEGVPANDWIALNRRHAGNDAFRNLCRSSPGILASHALIAKLAAIPAEPITRRGRRQFTRGGPLQPAFVVSLLLSLVRHGDQRGYTRTIESFWHEAQSFGLPLPQQKPVSAQAFSEARAKLPAAVVRCLLQRVSGELDAQHGADFLWRGRRLLAVDGACRVVQASDALRRAFGGPQGSHYPQIHVTALFDVCSQAPLDAVVGRYGSDERAQLFEVVGQARPRDVLVLDRGYPSFDVLAMLRLHELDFVVRVPASSTFKEVSAFLATGRGQGVVRLHPHDRSHARGMESFAVRVVVVPRRGEEPWVLLTSLPAAEFPADAVADAYTRRWRVEEHFKLLAGSYFGQGFFHGRTVRGVEQEVFAQMLFVAVARCLAAAAAKIAQVPYERLSQKAVVLAMADHLTRIVLGGPAEQARAHLLHLLRRIGAAVYRPRPGRSYPRRSLLPARKWARDGKRNRR